jgi:hypothetical protein
MDARLPLTTRTQAHTPSGERPSPDSSDCGLAVLRRSSSRSSPSGFTHLEHVELAWNYLRLYSIDDAAEIMAAAIKHVGRLHGAEDKYHDTITRAWLHFVAVHIEGCAADSFEEFIDHNPELLDSKLIQHFYSRELLFSEPARASWSAPDLRQLPALA